MTKLWNTLLKTNPAWVRRNSQWLAQAVAGQHLNMKKLSLVANAFSLSLLIVIFILMFGLQSCAKYRKGGITIEHSTEYQDEGIQFPALTFCPYKGNPKSAWRNGSASTAYPDGILPTECKRSSADAMTDCIVEMNYNEKDLELFAEVRSPTGRLNWTWSKESHLPLPIL